MTAIMLSKKQVKMLPPSHFGNKIYVHGISLANYHTGYIPKQEFNIVWICTVRNLSQYTTETLYPKVNDAIYESQDMESSLMSNNRNKM